jgi:hypothetical protein
MRLPRLTAAILPLLLSSVVAGQTTESKPTAPSKTTLNKKKSNTETDEQRQRRSQARSLLMALSTDARTFTDPTLRARSLARIADALWQVDEEQGRLMFRKSWEAAEVADQENDQKMQQEVDRQKAKTGGSGYVLNTPPKIRREVLVLAARHDRTLSEEFLEKLKTQKLEAANNLRDPGPYGLSEALSQRINVARDLMQAGEIERALQLADAALTVVSIDTVNFLSDLREKAPGPADNRYAAMLTSAAANPQSDGNTVSLLSSYIFTPHLFIIFRGASSTNTSQRSDKVVPADVSPELRLAFFQAAASILLRPIAAAATTPNTNVSEAKAVDPNDIESRYLMIKRLLPFFELSAPTELTESLRAQLNTMNAMVSENARRRDDEWLSKGIKPDKPAADQEQALLDRADRAKTSAERDSVYIQLAFLLARRGDMRARDYVSKVDDAETRKGIQAYIDPFLAGYFIQKKLTDQALEMATKGELTHVQRAWLLTECAKLLQKTDRDKASELIEGAATEARRIDVSDPFLPRALLAVANAVALVDPPRVWDATFDAVKAANSATGFSGEDGELVYSFQSKSQRSISSSSVAEFDVEGIFKQLAILDYERAVELARGFEGEGPRAVATIAIARAILEPRKKASAVKN